MMFVRRRKYGFAWIGGATACLVLSCLCVSCGDPVETSFNPAYFNLPETAFFPTETNNPADNRLCAEGVELGRYLFYDNRIAATSDHPEGVSCSECHRQAAAFDCGADNLRFVRGGLPLPLQNLAYNTRALGWSGTAVYPATTLEDFIRHTLADSAEFALPTDSIIAHIAAIPLYPKLYEAAFGTQDITLDRTAKALAQFVRTLTSTHSKFDRYMRGEERLSDEEMQGYVLFTTEEGADCFHCHGGAGNVLFSTYMLAVNGLDESDVAYRIPSLRNIAHTAPYMHDGRFATLEEVIDRYSEHVYATPHISPLMHHADEGGVQLTPREKQCLKAFLLTLSDEDFITNPRFSNPFEK
ncbi:MAG: hypothetical protein K2O37_01970 [Bacteroidales bacterium]|nr:hypothetical protein [Bacteroidales bacterium]